MSLRSRIVERSLRAIRLLSIRRRRLVGDSSGQVAIIVALMALPLMVAVGIGVDYARASTARAKLQSVVDAAVLAGATDGSNTWTTTAKAVLDAGLTQAKAAGLTVGTQTFAIDAGGNYTGTVTAKLPTTFMVLVSQDSMDIGATATAAVVPASDMVCILLLDKSAAPGLLLNGGATINAPSCQVHVASTANPAATFNAGTTLATKKTCVAGANVLDNGGSHASLVKSCTTTADPFAGTLPTPSTTCTVNNLNVNASTILTPGVYCGGVNFNGSPTVSLAAGVYVIKGGNWNFSGTLTGTGVTFYFADQSYIQFNGTSTLNLTAPTSGTYANLLIYEAAGLAKSSFTMNATNGATLQGLIYLPSRQFTLNANANVTSNKLTMVLDTLTVNTVNWTLASSDKSIPTSAGGATASIYLKK